MSNLIEISLVVDSEAAEAVSELFNRYNGGGWEEDSTAGEASGGGAILEATGLDDDGTPIDGKYQLTVKTYVKSGTRGDQIRQQIEEGLWHLGRIYPMAEPQIRTVHQEDWANSWKQFYKPLRIGQRVWLKPSWEAIEAAPGDVVIELGAGHGLWHGDAPDHAPLRRRAGGARAARCIPVGHRHGQRRAGRAGRQARRASHCRHRHRPRSPSTPRATTRSATASRRTPSMCRSAACPAVARARST